MSTAEQLAALSARLRNGGWDLRSPQELADIIADHIDAISQSTTPAQAPAQAAEPVDSLQLYKRLCDLVAEAGAVDTVIGRPAVLRAKLAELRDEIGRMTDAYIPAAAPHPSEPAATGRVGLPEGWALETGVGGFGEKGDRWVCVRNLRSQLGQDFYEDRDPLIFAFLNALATGSAAPTGEA